MFNCTKCRGLVDSSLPAVQAPNGTNKQAICAGGGPHDLDTRGEYLPNSSSGSGQPNWWACNLCATVFFAGNGLGVCSVKHHDHTGSGDYLPIFKGGGGQAGWWQCSNCSNLFFSPNGTNIGVCANGGEHVLDPELTYSLSSFVGQSGGQAEWYYCNQCRCLYFGPSNKAGACPGAVGGPHTNGGGNYWVPQSGPGDTGWKWCNRCSCLHFPGGVFPGGVCNFKSHDNHLSTQYILPEPSDGEWRYCNNCKMLFLPLAGGTCPAQAGGHHSGGGNYGVTFEIIG
jgi:hypothetical protein